MNPWMIAVVLSMLVVSSACKWQPYVANRAFRQVTGQKMRFHPIVPLTANLANYETLEVHKLENLMLEQIPPDLEAYLNSRLIRDIKALNLFSDVVRNDQESILPGRKRAKPTLIFEGKIDDYHPGYLGLRLLELGYNHIATTIRIQLRDKDTGAIVGSASVTVHENRPNGTPKTAANRLSKEVQRFIQSGFKEPLK